MKTKILSRVTEFTDHTKESPAGGCTSPDCWSRSRCLNLIDVPTLVLHGDADQIVPFLIYGQLTAKIVKHATLKVYPGFPHGLCTTEVDTINKIS